MGTETPQLPVLSFVVEGQPIAQPRQRGRIVWPSYEELDHVADVCATGRALRDALKPILLVGNYTPSKHPVNAWKQAVGSLIHCVAGDATAIIGMAALLHFFEVPNGIEVIFEYIAAYLFGLFIFQALFMRSMFASYGMAVKKTIFVETVSMNMVMTGMFPVIVAIKYHYPIASNPMQPYFWGTMSLATIVGFLVAYPINAWMVGKGIKHGMMSKGMTMHHEPVTLPMRQMIFYVVGTFLIFFAALLATSFFAPLRFG